MDMPDPTSEADFERVTLVLQALANGEREAAERLLPLVYEDLRKLARARMARVTPGQTLQATALVHDAYLRVTKKGDPGWEGRAHFFGAAALAMRDILVEQARRKSAAKRGGDRERVGDADDVAIATLVPAEDVLALDEALARLQQRSERQARIVMLRFFTGLEMEEVASMLGLSISTVEREWRFARSWLQRQLGASAPKDPEGGAC